MRSALFIGVMLAIARIAQAQPPDPEQSEADRLFEEGRALAKDKRWAEACERFDRSFLLDPTPGTTLNLADCREHLGQLKEAWQLFDAAAQKLAAVDDEKRAQFARERRDTITRRAGTIVVQAPAVAPAGLEIAIAGRAVAATGELRELVEPGPIEIVARVPGRPAFTKTVTVAAGKTEVVVIPPFIDEVRPVPVRTSPRRTRVRIAWGLAGAAGASAIAATVLTLKARGNYNATADGAHCMRVVGGITCDDIGDNEIADAQGLADIGTGFAVASGILLVASAAVYFTAPREPVVVAPSVTGRAAGVLFRMRF